MRRIAVLVSVLLVVPLAVHADHVGHPHREEAFTASGLAISYDCLSVSTVTVEVNPDRTSHGWDRTEVHIEWTDLVTRSGKCAEIRSDYGGAHGSSCRWSGNDEAWDVSCADNDYDGETERWWYMFLESTGDLEWGYYELYDDCSAGCQDQTWAYSANLGSYDTGEGDQDWEGVPPGDGPLHARLSPLAGRRAADAPLTSFWLRGPHG